MGRAFEKRKGKKEARWGKMAVAFTRLGKEIAMAVKANGPNPDSNARLRTAIQNAKGVNMPKDRIDGAIKRASSKEENNYEETIYEGYAPHAVAILIETATDNINRTVGNIRSYFMRSGGALGKTGSLDFIFTRKGVFSISKEGTNMDELELELIDFGLEEIIEEEDEITIYTSFTDFGQMVKALEEKKINVISAKLERIPNSFVELSEEQEEEVIKLIEKFEDDDDVQAVYHNIA